ncbi:MAG: 3-oxoacyl-ACP reductase [Spirochaetes bacterium]|nr:MAG: 3-oxoacyl-ACP reductase [Spirochaetota bacterium]
MELKGKNALITGGNRGIGRATAFALAERGVNVGITYFRGKKKAEEVIESARARGLKACAVQCDIKDFKQVEKMVSQVIDKLGGIDFLINNAGISGPSSRIDDISVEEWREVLDTNLSGSFYCCKALKGELVRRKGKIVNISSIAAKMGGTIGSHYAASKAGLLGLTFALTNELAPHVTVNAIAPGPVDTELISEEVKKKLSALTPFGRIARPEEIAHTVIYLLENDYVSGEVIDVNAGRYMD